MEIIKSFKKIILTLRDYPGINTLINLDEANKLIEGLDSLPEEIISILIQGPKTGEFNKVTEAINERRKKWQDALEKINVDFFDHEPNDDKNIIFWGSITLNEEPNIIIYLRLLTNNKAELMTDETSYKIVDDFSGTWEDVYNKVVEIKNNFIPTTPNN